MTAIYTHNNPDIQIMATDYLAVSTYPYSSIEKLSTNLDAGSNSVLSIILLCLSNSDYFQLLETTYSGSVDVTEQLEGGDVFLVKGLP